MTNSIRSFFALILAGALSACASATPQPVSQGNYDPLLPVQRALLDNGPSNSLSLHPPGETWKVHIYGTFNEQPQALAVAYDEWARTTIRFDRLASDPAMPFASYSLVADAHKLYDITRGKDSFKEPASFEPPHEIGKGAVAFSVCNKIACTVVVVARLPKQPDVLIQASARCAPAELASIEPLLIAALSDATYH